MKHAIITGASIRHTRKGLSLTGREVARKAGISAAYLCDIEQGNRSVPLDTLEAIRKALVKARIIMSHRACETCGGNGEMPVPIMLCR